MSAALAYKPATDAAAPMPRRSGILRRQCACGTHTTGGATCGKCAGAPARADTSVPPAVNQVLAGPGHPLDGDTRAFMQQRFDHDFSHVRIHAGGRAAQSAASADALAYTVGSHVVFGAGSYAPQSGPGQRLLAHELAHVVQNDRHPGAGAIAAKAVSGNSDASEIEADAAAERISKPGLKIHISQPPAAAVQRISTGAAIGLGVLGAATLGVGIAALAGAFSGSKSAVPTLKDPAFRAQWEAALQQSKSVLEPKEPKEGCSFPNDGPDKYDEENWTKDTTGLTGLLGGKSYAPKSGKPHDAVADLFQNLDKWACDCRLYSELIVLYAWFRTLTPEQFNTKFAGFHLRAESTTGLDRTQAPGAGVGGAEYVDPAAWKNAPAGTKVAWQNTSPAARTPWDYEHAVKLSKAGPGGEDFFAAQGIGYNVTEAEAIREVARHAPDSPFVYRVTDAVLGALKSENIAAAVLTDLATIKDRSFKTYPAFLGHAPLHNVPQGERDEVIAKILKAACTYEPKDEIEQYIKTNILRSKAEIPN
jgi:hypothetical protein